MNRHEEEAAQDQAKHGAPKPQASPAVPGRARTLFDLQRAAGNRAVSRMLAKPGPATAATVQREFSDEDLEQIKQLIDEKIEQHGASLTPSPKGGETTSQGAGRKAFAKGSKTSYSTPVATDWTKKLALLEKQSKPLTPKQAEAKKKYEALAAGNKKRETEEADRARLEERLGEGSAAGLTPQQIKDKLARLDRQDRKQRIADEDRAKLEDRLGEGAAEGLSPQQVKDHLAKLDRQDRQQRVADEDRAKLEDRGEVVPKNWTHQQVKDRLAVLDRQDRRTRELEDLRNQATEFNPAAEEEKEDLQEKLALEKWNAQKDRLTKKMKGRTSLYNWS